MIKIAIVGLDTSHSVTMPKLMQAPDCPADQRVPGLRAVSCLRFETPFQGQEGLDKRQSQLEAWGVPVTTCFEEAVANCDAIMLEINDGSRHLEYFRKVAGLGKPVFLDKPLATTLADGRAILRLAKKHKTRVWSSSSIVFCPPIMDLRRAYSEVRRASVFGALGRAPAGDSLVWYGVHTVEMLLHLMGLGAVAVRAMESTNGIILAVDFGGGRQGVVEVNYGSAVYGGRVDGVRGGQNAVEGFVCDSSHSHHHLLRQIKKFFAGAPAPVDLTLNFEALAVMVAGRRSIETGKSVKVARL